jgi:hypothetical protein
MNQRRRMVMVTVYRFKVWDQMSGESILTRRMATRKAIETKFRGEVIEETAIEVEFRRLDGDESLRLDSRGLLPF